MTRDNFKLLEILTTAVKNCPKCMPTIAPDNPFQSPLRLHTPYMEKKPRLSPFRQPTPPPPHLLRHPLLRRRVTIAGCRLTVGMESSPSLHCRVSNGCHTRRSPNVVCESNSATLFCAEPRRQFGENGVLSERCRESPTKMYQNSIEIDISESRRHYDELHGSKVVDTLPKLADNLTTA